MPSDEPKKRPGRRSRKPPKSPSSGSPRQPKPNPQLRSLIMCDYVIADAFTSKISIIGLFNAFNFTEYPAKPAPFMIFTELMDGIGRYTLSLDIVEVASSNAIGSGVIADVVFEGRMQPVLIRVPIPPLTIPRPGKYDLVLYADGVEVTRAPLTCNLRPTNPPTEESQ